MMKALACLLFLSTAALGAEWKRPDAHGRCAENKPLTGDAGIARLICYGGSCTVNERHGEGAFRHSFSTEPAIDAIGHDSPASGLLRENDVIVAVDGALITTREGGRRLASLTPSVPVRLRVRRGTQERDIVVTPTTGCNMPSLRVTGRDSNATRVVEKHATAPIDFGMQLDCNKCGWRHEGGRLVWRARDFPRVIAIIPGGPADRAGIAAGDVLLRAGGHPIVHDRAGDALASLAPGKSIALEIVRNGSKLIVHIAPRAEASR